MISVRALEKSLLALSCLGLIPACGGDDGIDAQELVATGELGPFTATTSLPEPSVNHCATVVGDLLIVVGGNHKPVGSDEFVRHDSVLASQIGDDGALSAWQQIGTTPSAVQGCVLTNDGERLLLVSGSFDNPDHQGQVWAAALESSGALDAWKSMGAHPVSENAMLIGTEAWIDGSFLIVNGTTLPQESDISFTASVDVSGATLGAWNVDYWLDGFRYQAQHAKVGNHIYHMGGYGNVNESNVVYTETNVAVVDETGAVVDSFATTEIPAQTTFGEAVAVDDFVLLVGGRSGIAGGGYSSAVYVAAAAADGRLGAWSQASDLPTAMSSHDVVVGSEHIYVIGGSDGDDQLDTVYSALARYPEQ